MIKEAPKGWNLVNFDSFFTVLPSKKYQVQKQDYLEKGLVPVVDQGQKLIIGYTDDESKKFNKNNVIIFGDHTRIVKYIDFDFAVGADGTQILETKDGINLKFGYYQLLNKKIPDTGYNRHFKYVKAEKYVIPPTLAEQQEIVQVLDTMSDIIRLREECISHAQDLIPALFQEMFDNPQTNKKNLQICHLKDLAKIDRQNISPEELKTKRYTYIGLEHIEKETGRILVDPNAQLDIDLKSNKFFFTSNHVLYGKLRPYLNKVALPDFDGVCSTDIFPLLPLEGISNKYFLKALMSTSYFVNMANSQSSGANLPRIGTTALENIKVFKPDYNLQEQFAEKVREINSYIEEQQEELENAKQMFQSLLHHAFTGELTKHKYGE